MSQSPATLYKVLTGPCWRAGEAGGAVPTMPIDTADGFVHLSTATQLAETLALHFKGQGDLVIVAVRTANLDGHLKWEPSRGGQLFPHVYGAIPMTTVEWIENVGVAADGTVDLPDRVA